MVYRLHSGVTGNKIQKLKQKSINLTMAFMLAFTGLGATPLLWAQTATALSSSEVVYDALPSVTPSTNYVSLGYQATSTSEMGDLIHLGGTNRVLNTVTVTMSDWAKYSTYSSDASYNSANWSHPITLTVYDDSLAGDGTPDAILASKTQTFDIPWRPESDPTCGDTSNGKGWIEDGTCYDYSGIAFNITFDLSSLAITLPDDVIVGVSYNTQSYGTSPLGVGGPYNSLNVAIPTNQIVATGSDDDTDAIFWNTSHCAWYTDGGASGCGTFREDNNWAPYATVALQITATAPMPPSAPMNVRISDDGTNVPSGSYVNASFVPGYTVLNFDAVNGADKYITEVTYPGGSKNLWNSYNNTWLIKNGVPSQGEFTSHGEGEYSYRVKARSATNGLWSDWSSSVKLVYDTTAPSVSWQKQPVSYYGDGQGFHVRPITTEVGTTKSVYVDTIDSANLVWTLTSDHKNFDTKNTNNQALWDSLTDGTHKFIAVFTDYAGNNTTKDSNEFVIDRTKPNVSITSPSNSAVLGSNFIVNGTASDNVSYIDRVEFTVNKISGFGGTYISSVSSGTATGTNDWEFPATALAEGYYRIKVQAFDAAGNWKYSYHDIYVDTTAPTISIKDGFVGNETAKIFSDVSFKLFDANQVDKYVLNGWTRDFTNNKWSDANFQNIKNHLVEGSNTFVLYDVAGNTTTYEFTYDSTAPVVTVDPLVTTSSTPTLTGTVDDDDATVEVTVNGNTYMAVVASGAWSVDVTDTLPVDTYDVVATATDLAGNAGSDVTSNELTVNTAVLGASSNTPAAQNAAVTPTSFATNTPAGFRNSSSSSSSSNSNKESDENGEVQGASTTSANLANTPDDDTVKNSNFMGLGWWWLPLLALLFGFFFIALGRRSDQK